MILKSLGSLSLTWSSAGAVSVAAFSKSWVYLRPLPLLAWRTVADPVLHSDSGTPQVWAAAVTKSARPEAPTWRMDSQWVGVAVLPPALCDLYLSVSRLACSMRTFFQSTSSSSAMSIGSMVLTPCPISGFCATMVTLPSGRNLIQALSRHSEAVRTVALVRTVPPRRVVRSNPPPATRLAWRNSRRLTRTGALTGHLPASPRCPRHGGSRPESGDTG